VGGNKGLSTPTACTARTLYTERERVEILFDLLRLMYVQQFYFTTYKYPCVCRDECFSPKNCASVMFKKHFFFVNFSLTVSENKQHLVLVGFYIIAKN